MKNLISRITYFLLWLLLAVVLVFPFGYLYLFHPDKNFWDSATGNWLATLAALIGGIPIALAINRSILRQENLDRSKADRAREKEILSLIREELEFSLNSLFLPDRKGNLTSITIQQYKSDLWDALAAGEELKYINDPALLNRIASAYYALKSAKEIETQAYIASRTSAITFTVNGQSRSAAQMLLNDARVFDGVFEANVSTAITEINKRLELLETNQ